MKNENYFPGFAWAVRKAFKPAIASCRFEQGDILYDTPKAYEGTWSEAQKHLRFSIQVKSPTSGIRAIPDPPQEDGIANIKNNLKEKIFTTIETRISNVPTLCHSRL